MENEKSELRRILDLFEGAGFTITYYQEIESAEVYEIGMKSTVIKDIRVENEPAGAGEIAALVNSGKYRLTDYKTSGVAKYGGTVYIMIQKVPPENAN